MQWVKTTEGLRDVMNRHYPEITAKWMKSSSAFSVWDADQPISRWAEGGG